MKLSATAGRVGLIPGARSALRQNIYPIVNVLAAVVMVVSITMLVPLVLALVRRDDGMPGFVTSALAFVELCYILVTYLRGNVVPGWASVMTVMSLMFGVLFVLLGIIGTYLAKVYEILKRRPRFVVGDRVGFGPHEAELPSYDR